MALLTSFSQIWRLRRLFSALAVAKRGKVPTPGWQNTVPSCSRELPFFALIFFLCLPHYFAALMHIFAAPFELFTNSYISSRRTVQQDLHWKWDCYKQNYWNHKLQLFGLPLFQVFVIIPLAEKSARHPTFEKTKSSSGVQSEQHDEYFWVVIILAPL